ncbi:NADH-ubiquinone oxidoreductase [Histoplasma ohiense]|nr:NADH-ubiquinone oxidoreductase [Histoplasma ohiense (nom. inval.)]
MGNWKKYLGNSLGGVFEHLRLIRYMGILSSHEIKTGCESGKRKKTFIVLLLYGFVYHFSIPMHVPVVSQQFDLPILVGQAVGIQKLNRRH